MQSEQAIQGSIPSLGDTTLTRVRETRTSSQAPAGVASVVFPRALAGTFSVYGGSFVLGRQGNGRIPHPTVSRVHLEIAWDAASGVYTARDLGSHNGSSLDDAPLGAEPRSLRDGSVLRLGEVVVVWEFHSSPAPLAPARPPRPPIPTRDEFIAAFEQFNGNVRAIARHFVRERRQIYRWIAAHGVREGRNGGNGVHARNGSNGTSHSNGSSHADDLHDDFDDLEIAAESEAAVNSVRSSAPHIAQSPSSAIEIRDTDDTDLEQPTASAAGIQRLRTRSLE